MYSSKLVHLVGLNRGDNKNNFRNVQKLYSSKQVHSAALNRGEYTEQIINMFSSCMCSSKLVH